jgi:hypothetical protein
MPLTNADRRRIREVESLKDEIRRELHPHESKLSQNPTFLLVLGFILTSVAGSGLTYFWKQRDWKNQQSYLVQQRALDKKYAVIESTFKEVATTTAAAEDVLSLYYGDNWTEKQIPERLDNWDKTSRSWRISSKVLSAKLTASFQNSSIYSTFEKILDKRRQLGRAILQLPRRKSNVAVTPEIQKDAAAANQLADNIVDLLRDCGSLMNLETRPPPN